jgi:hypothetical protein
MLDFITIPVTFGIVTYGIYSIFSLFVRRKERFYLIEKLGDRVTPELLAEEKINLPAWVGSKSFGALKAAMVLLGLGIGLLAGFLVTTWYDFNNWDERGTVYGACVLITGGLALLIAFLVEYNLTKTKK